MNWKQIGKMCVCDFHLAKFGFDNSRISIINECHGIKALDSPFEFSFCHVEWLKINVG